MTKIQHTNLIPYRTLGIDGGSRWIGWAVTDAGQPSYWGTIDLRTAGDHIPTLKKRVRVVLGRILADLRPSVVALEAPTNTSAPKMRAFKLVLAEIERLVRGSGARALWISPSRARLLVTGDGWATKEVVARVLARSFPEMRRWLLPRTAKEIARYVHHSSDALCVALAINHPRLTRHL